MTDYTITRYNPYTDQELIEAIQKYATERKIKNVASSQFCKWFGISETTIQRHFDSWANFCKTAGLAPRYSRSVNKEDLLKNLEEVWSELDRQPRAKEMKQPLSPISISRYQKIFQKTWYEICLEFISWKSGASVEEIERELRQVTAVESETHFNHKTNRSISLSLRYDILKRDNFRCVKCGASPALTPGTQLHIDHKIPWSKGGETEEANLQTLCSDCNLGKSNKA
jgi:5-methylcytosine-specific restriction endonuclease McrA